MAALKIVPGEYLNHDALERLIHGYVFHKALLSGGYGVDPPYAAEQMHIVKQYWNQTHGKQLRHFVLSFNEKESSEIKHTDDLIMGAYQICQYYYEGGYQNVFGIHRPINSKNWHIHFVVNNVNFLTGERLPESNRLDYELKMEILACNLPVKQIQIYYD